VFAAWSDPTAKARWFMGPDEWESTEFELDFRVGGRESNRGGPPGGPVHSYDARYHDIVPDRRIVYAYDMYLDDTRISVSVATVEVQPEGGGSRLIFTEQGAFLDGHDAPAQREQGMGGLLDALGASLQSEGAPDSLKDEQLQGEPG
jgi:uncharacterized protein YndB with AHSA1/START domain